MKYHTGELWFFSSIGDIPFLVLDVNRTIHFLWLDDGEITQEDLHEWEADPEQVAVTSEEWV